MKKSIILLLVLFSVCCVYSADGIYGGVWCDSGVLPNGKKPCICQEGATECSCVFTYDPCPYPSWQDYLDAIRQSGFFKSETSTSMVLHAYEVNKTTLENSPNGDTEMKISKKDLIDIWKNRSCD